MAPRERSRACIDAKDCTPCPAPISLRMERLGREVGLDMQHTRDNEMKQVVQFGSSSIELSDAQKSAQSRAAILCVDRVDRVAGSDLSFGSRGHMHSVAAMD